MYVRTFVLEHDYSSSLKRLMKFPPMEDVSILVRNAQRMESCKGKFSKLRRDGLKPASTKVPPPLPPWPSNKEKRPASGVSSKTSAITPRQVRCLRDCRDWSSRHLIHVIITHSTLSMYLSLWHTPLQPTGSLVHESYVRKDRCGNQCDEKFKIIYSFTSYINQ